MNFNLMHIEESRITLSIAFLLYIIASNSAFKNARDSLELLNDSILFRYIVVFSTLFVASQDIKVSGIITLAYAFIFDGLLNPDSKIAVVSKKKKPILPANQN